MGPPGQVRLRNPLEHPSRRLGLLLALTASVLIAISGPAAAWHYTFQDFFDIEGSAFSSGRATAEKCGPGGKLGTYKYRSFTQGTGRAAEDPR